MYFMVEIKVMWGFSVCFDATHNPSQAYSGIFSVFVRYLTVGRINTNQISRHKQRQAGLLTLTVSVCVCVKICVSHVRPLSGYPELLTPWLSKTLDPCLSTHNPPPPPSTHSSSPPFPLSRPSLMSHLSLQFPLSSRYTMLLSSLSPSFFFLKQMVGGKMGQKLFPFCTWSVNM